jgi:stage II sporulation protein AA (anti-sigma F factor antagonist)
MYHVAERDDWIGVELSTDEGQALVSISGDLDPHTATQLSDALGPLHKDDDIRRVVLDLGRTGFIDSSGLRTILSADEQLRKRGATLVLRSPSDAVMRLLEITDLVGRLDVE